MILNQGQQYMPGMLGGMSPGAQPMFPPRTIQPMPPSDPRMALNAPLSRDFTTPQNATYATHGPLGLNDRPWQVETTLQHPGRRRDFAANLRELGLEGTPEGIRLLSLYQNDKDAWRAQEQRNYNSMGKANLGGQSLRGPDGQHILPQIPYQPRQEARDLAKSFWQQPGWKEAEQSKILSNAEVIRQRAAAMQANGYQPGAPLMAAPEGQAGGQGDYRSWMNAGLLSGNGRGY